MKKFYFVFGSDPEFPYQNGWVEVHADDLKGAIAKFRTRIPDRQNGQLNCAFWYDEAEWAEDSDISINGWFGGFCHEVIE